MDQAPSYKSLFYLASGLSLVFATHLLLDQYRKHKKSALKQEFNKQKYEFKKSKHEEKEKRREIARKMIDERLSSGSEEDISLHLRQIESSKSAKLQREPYRFDSGLVQKIVLTGGPCAGKTTALTYISTKLRERGLKVLIVPETATILATGGGLINIQKMTFSQIIKLQSVIMKTIMDLEDHFCALAEVSHEHTVILCDRGVMDGKAYMDPEGWQVLLDENGFNVINLRDKRYDAIIHLVTAADGAEQYYSLENNAARYESSKEIAIEVDRKIRDAWVGHPALIIADNHTSKNFEEKIMKVFDSVLHVVGLPKAPKFYRKYLLKKNPSTKDPVPWIPEKYRTEEVDMIDTFLISKDPKIERKIRKRGMKGSYTYIYSVTSYNVSRDDMTDDLFQNDGIERKRQISAREYIALGEERDTRRKPLEKFRQCFIYEEEYFFIDTFLNIPTKFSLLNIEANKDLASINMPDFIKVDKDVTDILFYTSYNVALIEQEGAKAEENPQ